MEGLGRQTKGETMHQLIHFSIGNGPALCGEVGEIFMSDIVGFLKDQGRCCPHCAYVISATLSTLISEHPKFGEITDIAEKRRLLLKT